MYRKIYRHNSRGNCTKLKPSCCGESSYEDFGKLSNQTEQQTIELYLEWADFMSMSLRSAAVDISIAYWITLRFVFRVMQFQSVIVNQSSPLSHLQICWQEKQGVFNKRGVCVLVKLPVWNHLVGGHTQKPLRKCVVSLVWWFLTYF